MLTVRREKTDRESWRIDQAVKTDGDGLRRIDPDTARQWARVASVIAAGDRMEHIRSSPGRLKWPRPVIVFAGSLAILVIAGLFVLNRASTMTYETARREQSTVTLGDSSEVTLNHSSELIVERRPFDDTRRVGLKGEAFFRVRRSGAPFVVSTEIGTVRVLGTEFNVRVRDNGMEVAVLRGLVEVSVPHDEQVRSMTLRAGEMTLVSARGTFEPLQTIPYADYPGWLHGKFHFLHTSITDACREIESRFDIVITLKDPQLRNETVTGVLNGNSVESALAALCAIAGKEYRYEDGAYTLY
jgi:transmembrane sensor